MPSGKRAKAQRRQAVPPPPVRGGGPGLGARQASPRTLAIAGGVILLVILAVVLGIVLTQSSGSKTTTGPGGYDGSGDAKTITLASGTPSTGSPTGKNAYPDAPAVDKLFKGIPQSGLVLGNANAPATLVEYIDLQCPVCRSFELTMLPTLVDKYVRPGKLKIVMKPWNILDRAYNTVDSYRGQEATIAASKQNKVFQFSEVLYNNQLTEGTSWMNDLTISNIAASVDGLKTQQFVTDANSSATAALIKSIDDYASSQPNFLGTPTLLLGKGTQTPRYYSSSLPSLAALEVSIDKLLK